MRRVLIVNADDFGRSHGINRGIALAHDEGVVTSTSAMVCWPAAEEAAALVLARPSLGIGLHVDLAEWTYADGEWQLLYERAPSEERAVEEEVERQLHRFRELFARDPTHVDSHQHVHREEPVRSVVLRLGQRLGVPVRDLAESVVYRGDFYGQTGKGEPFPAAIGVDALLGLIASLPTGVTELGCHPAAEPELDSSYSAERVEELRVLCNPRVKATIDAEGIELRSFDGIAALERG